MYIGRILIIGIFYTLYKTCILKENKPCIISEINAQNIKRLKHRYNWEKINSKHEKNKKNRSSIGVKLSTKYSFVNSKVLNGEYNRANWVFDSLLTEKEVEKPFFSDLDDWNDHRLVDLCEIQVSGGDGGDGCLSFRREKHVPLGGASGGNGGPGGDVVIKCDLSVSDLKNFNYNKIYKAEKGSNGKGSNRNGGKGKDLCLCVPPGTVIYGENNEVYATLLNDGEKIRIARGGRGGKGNRHFITRMNNAPRVCERGEAGISRKIRLIFKKPSDIALVGKPNSGKSSIIKQLTNAKPRVANFPFSTKFPIHGVIQFQKEDPGEGQEEMGGAYDEEEDEDFFEGDFESSDTLYNEHEQENDGDFSDNGNEDPNYNENEEEDDMASVNGADVNGVMESTKNGGDNSFVKNLMIVDIPGLISGSSSGRGLGHDFLRHIERCKIISYVVDSNVQNPLADYLDVKKEVGTYDPSLLNKPEIILLNKIDLIDNKRVFELMNSFIKECDHDRIYFLSAKTRENVDFISLLFNQIYTEFVLNNDRDTGSGQEDVDDTTISGNESTDEINSCTNKTKERKMDKLDEFRNLSRRFKIEHEDGIFTIKSPYLERKVKMMRFDLPETLDRFRHILKVNKIRRRLVNLGLKPGDVLKIGDVSFTVQTDEFFI